jgi:aspartate-semialdehyde dehydrogenase
MSGYVVAICGASGAVGQEFIRILEQREFPVRELRLLASARSAGREMLYKGVPLTVQETTREAFRGVDLALFSAGAGASREWAPAAVAAGAVVVDNSSAWRMEPDIPLVVPEVNPEDIGRHGGIIANPNCSTIQMVVALQPLHRANPLKRVIVDTYQSVSGAGGRGIIELQGQTADVLAGRAPSLKVHPQQIAFNVIPKIDVFMDDGYYKEEWKMIHETRKIMHLPNLAVSATCVRVPVVVGHAEAVHAEFERPMNPAEARALLAEAPGVVVVDNAAEAVYPLPIDAAGRDEVFVGRIRQDASHPNGLAMWIVSDNVRKGAALNAVQIAERLVGSSGQSAVDGTLHCPLNKEVCRD